MPSIDEIKDAESRGVLDDVKGNPKWTYDFNPTPTAPPAELPGKRLLMCGFENSGKTTILYRLKMHEHITTVPTIGFNVENIDIGNNKYTVWDIGGLEKIRPLWVHYIQDTLGIIYVIDSSDDIYKIRESRDFFENFLVKNSWFNVPILILANKQDLPDVRPLYEIEPLFSHFSATLAVRATSCHDETSISDALSWFDNVII